MIELTQAERDLLAEARDGFVEPVNHFLLKRLRIIVGINTLLARDAANRGKVAVSRKVLEVLVDEANEIKRLADWQPGACSCEECLASDAAIAEAEAALKKEE